MKFLSREGVCAMDIYQPMLVLYGDGARHMQ